MGASDQRSFHPCMCSCCLYATSFLIFTWCSSRYLACHLRLVVQNPSLTMSLLSLSLTERSGSETFKYIHCFDEVWSFADNSDRSLKKIRHSPLDRPRRHLLRSVLVLFSHLSVSSKVLSVVRRYFLTQVCAIASFEYDLLTRCHEEFISPASVRSAIRREQGKKYRNRKEQQQEFAQRKEGMRREEDELAVSKVFA
jgi:hypothetical protein